MDELGSGCTAQPGRDLQGSSPCTTEAQTRAAPAQLPLSTQNLNLPNLTEVSPLGLCPGVTQRAGPPPPAAWMRVSLGAVPGSLPPQRPEDTHARQRLVQKQLVQEQSGARDVLVRSRAKTGRVVLLQDTALASPAPCQGWDGCFCFFSPLLSPSRQFGSAGQS